MPKYLVRAIYKSHRDLIIEADDVNKALALDGEIVDEDEVYFEIYDVTDVERVEE